MTGADIEAYYNFEEGHFYKISESDFEKVKHIKSVTAAAPKKELFRCWSR
jgi:hypothetical protein